MAPRRPAMAAGAEGGVKFSPATRNILTSEGVPAMRWVILRKDMNTHQSFGDVTAASPGESQETPPGPALIKMTHFDTVWCFVFCFFLLVILL